MISFSLLILSLGAAAATKCGHKNANQYTPITRIYCLRLEDMDWDYAVASTEELYDLTYRSEDEAKYQLNDDAPKLPQYAKRGKLVSYTPNGVGCNWNKPLIQNNTVRDGILGPTIR